jgi:hypothetical protein
MVEAEGSDLINHRVVPTSGINGRQNPGFRTGNGRFISYPCGVESAGVLRTRIGGDARRGVDRVIACRDLASSCVRISIILDISGSLTMLRVVFIRARHLV